jgi:endonuclease YncB( thermonuclease family)
MSEQPRTRWQAPISRATIAAVLALSFTTQAYAFDAVVSYCHDGDTCTLADGTRVRLHAIDAPEIDQPYGKQARVWINRMIAGEHVDVRPTGAVSHGRTVAAIYFRVRWPRLGGSEVEHRSDRMVPAGCRAAGPSRPLGRQRRDPAMAMAP